MGVVIEACTWMSTYCFYLDSVVLTYLDLEGKMIQFMFFFPFCSPQGGFVCQGELISFSIYVKLLFCMIYMLCVYYVV